MTLRERTFCLLTGLVLLNLPGISGQNSDRESASVSASVSALFASKYFAPIGFSLEDDNSALQGAATVVVEGVITRGDGLDAFVWGNLGFNDGPGEIDWGIGYSLPLPRGSVRVGFEQYRYPDGLLGDFPEDMLRLTVTRTSIADLTLDGYWRVGDGFKKQFLVNLGVSKSLTVAEQAARKVTVTPRATAIYNKDLWGLTGYAGTMLGTTVELRQGSVTAYGDVLQFLKSGKHMLEHRMIKNQTVVQIGMRIDTSL